MIKTGCRLKYWGAVILFLLSPSVFAEKNPYYIDPPGVSQNADRAELGGCTITILTASLWRDWMPIVSRPGPDGGSPLYGKISVKIDNSKDQDQVLSFQVKIIDEKVQTYSVPLRIVSTSTNPGQLDGRIAAGAVMQYELSTDSGPYLPAGSTVHVEITVTNQKGESATVKSRDVVIDRTD